VVGTKLVATLNFSLKPIQSGDIPQVKEIEMEAFPENRSSSFLDRVARNPLSAYLVAWKPSSLQANGGHSVEEVGAEGMGNVFIKRVLGVVGRDYVHAMQPEIAISIGGYVGVWFPLDEAHINSIAVRKCLRGQGLGEMLLIGAIELAQTRVCALVTLEVRVSNIPARNLYGKYGFREVGFRKGYYTDNNEDALIMTTDNIQSLDYRQSFESLVDTFRENRGDLVRVLRS
jgi:ribosomal-protein-alanine N-acetyltransferase